MENISFQVRDMKPAYRDKSVAKINGHNSYHYGRQQLRERSRIEQKSKLQERNRCKSHPCDYCGHTGFHTAGEDCPAYGKQCRNCGIWNHFAAVCKSKARNESNDIQGASNKFKPNRDLVKKTTKRKWTVPMTNL